MNSKHNFKKFRILEQRGITLLLVMVILSALLSIGAGIFNIALGQLKISGEIGDSFIAFYAADQGIERTLFRDRNIAVFSDGYKEPSNDNDPGITVDSGGCYKVRVGKTGNETTITAVGQYRCGANPNRVVKRGFLLTYLNTGVVPSPNPPGNFGTGADLFNPAQLAAGFNDLTTKSISGRSAGDMVNFSITTNLTPGTTVIPISTTGLAVGDEVLIINLQRTGSGSLNAVGEWETGRVAAIGSVTLENGLSRRYDGTNYRIMLQRVPNYNYLTINAGQQLGTSAWDGTKGGVFFARVLNTLTIAASGEITATGKGYRGGASATQGESRVGTGISSTNNNDGGGGGFSGIIDGGAGGAGYAFNGSQGGTADWGFGGNVGTAYGDTDLMQLFLGSGGGGGGGCAPGRGGNGGGIIYIAANVIVNSGTIRANASSAIGGCPAGQTENIWTGSGGGSGGSLFIQSISNPLGTVEVLGTPGVTGNVGTYCIGFSGDYCWGQRVRGGAGSVGRSSVAQASGPPIDVDGDTFTAANDCNDLDAAVWQNLPGYENIDGDSRTLSTQQNVCSGATLLLGYVASPSAQTDCNDGVPTIWQLLPGYRDQDSDGFTIGGVQQVCSGATLLPGYRANASAIADCYDLLSQARPNQTSYFTANRGDGSFDYNCNNQNDLQPTPDAGCGSLTWPGGVSPGCGNTANLSGYWYDESTGGCNSLAPFPYTQACR